MKTTYSIASALLITAICSAGCYRTVAKIHVDASHNLVVNKTENAKDDQVPPVVKTEGGLQEVRIDRKRYKLKIESRPQASVKMQSSQEDTVKETFRSPNTVSIEKEGRLTIKDKKGASHHYSSDDVNEITLRYRDSNRSKARAGIALTVTGSFVLASGLGLLGFETFIAVPVLCSSALFLAPGIPLWAVGGRRLGYDKKYNRGLKISGIALTITGASLVAAGAVSSVAFGGFEIPIIMGTGFGLPLLAFGIPLWVVGARRLKRSAAIPDPTISISPKTSTYGFGLKWTL
ncbi:MAG: hypothetical protein GY847_22640 [Proteobacteria bacterium]|nr:hypothetical protein [Pseudomonadota bacterium]